MAIKRHLPHVTKINIQSDNAKCYSNGALVFCLYLLCQTHKLELLSYIHTETQDGKGSIDAHFAVSMNHVLQHLHMGSNVVSPLELFSALQSNGGVANTIVSLYDIDRQCIEKLENKYKQSFEFSKHYEGAMK